MNTECALYIVATPIGNLSDMSQRAIEVLRSVAVVAAEDTRRSAKLLHFHQIATPLISYHDHGGEAQVERILSRLDRGESVALISDAGTPLISDPGYRLVSTVRQKGFNVCPVPGACALIAALSASGLPSDRFVFEGFPPPKKGARQAFFKGLADESRTIIMYESTHRITEALSDMCQVFGVERRCVLARELSKTYETFLCGTCAEVMATLDSDPQQRKGEFVILMEGDKSKKENTDVSDEGCRVMAVLLDELPLKQAASLAAKISGDKKNKLYDWGLSQKR